MTCIVAITDGQNLVFGADSIGEGPKPKQQIRKDPKIFTVGHFLIGFTTSFRMGQVLMHAELPTPPMTRDADKAHRFMVRELVPAARGLMEAGGFARSISVTQPEGYQETRHAMGGTFVVGFDGHLFEVQADYSVAMLETPYTAIGAAQLPALGALSATVDLDLPLEERASLALQAAERHTTSCCRPFRFLRQAASERQVH